MVKKLLKNAFIAFASLALCASVFMASCSSDDSNTVTLKTTQLDSLITICNSISAAATTDDYAQASITAFQTTLTNAIAARKTATTQTAIDALFINLGAAKTTFHDLAYGAIPEANLLFGLSFDEGSATTTKLTTSGARSWTAALTAGPIHTTTLPSFIIGKVGKAMYFSEGSHLEVSNYAANDLLGRQFSIAVWVKTDSIRSNNYIMSYNFWNTWKLNLQNVNRAYLTVSSAPGEYIIDNDGDVAGEVNNAEWTHIVVSLNTTTGVCDMYKNGVLSVEYTTANNCKIGSIYSAYATVLPLMIGACTTYDNILIKPADWTWMTGSTGKDCGYFAGAMDELKFYNIAVTAGQVAKLYKNENK